MKKCKVIAFLLGISLMSSVTALAVPLASYTHVYGNGAGQVDPGGNDVLSNGYVTISDQSTQRFNDAFNFSSLSYGSIDHFDLTLNYSKTDGVFLNPELWYARPGGTPDQYNSFKLSAVGTTATSSTYKIDASLDPEFNQMVAAENFYFWFAEETWFTDSFRLNSANLVIDGAAPVPEPGTIVLLGAGLAGLGIYGRRRMKK